MNLCGHHDMRTAKSCPKECWFCIPCCVARCTPQTEPRPNRQPAPAGKVPTGRPTGNRTGVGRGNARRHNTPECGTRGGHRKHLREGTDPCPECREASTRWRLDNKRYAA